MLGSGELLFQSKLTTASVRTRVAGGTKVINWLAKYWPNNPVPEPIDELLRKLALAIPLLTAPALEAMACTPALLVSVKGTR